ncbi:MAG: thiamine phosphate synthase [Planctomycetales bacterium]|nr:thiamine phosphate synthase [Planctomycetales bacterium]
MDIATGGEATAALRVVDANANRAAEGLRTLEDTARLVREDALAAEWLKQLRHQLGEVLAGIDRPQRLSSRDTVSDAGTQLTATNEIRRDNLTQVVTTASERVGQSLRCLEEYSKLLSPQLSQQFKQLRYAAYDVLAKVEIRLSGGERPGSARLYLLIDCTQELDLFEAYVRELAAAGVDWFQLRDKQAEGGKLLRYARCAVAALRESPARVIVNDRVDIALASGAAGVHVGQDDLPLTAVRRLAGSALWIGVSTHSLQQAQAAEAAGADYIGCGPTFPSSTKSFTAFPGLELIRQVSAAVRIPLFAIGGIDLQRVGKVVQCGCRRIAVSHAIHAASQPTAAASALKKQLS